MATNMRNFGICEGRLTRDPKVFTNSDGSKKVMLNVAVQDNFKSGPEQKKGSQFIQLEAFVSNKQNGIGVFGYMHKGDMVGLGYTVRTNNYTDRDGNKVYSQVLLIQDVDLKESKTTTDARMAKRQSEGAGEPAPAPAASYETPAAGAPSGDADQLPFG